MNLIQFINKPFFRPQKGAGINIYNLLVAELSPSVKIRCGVADWLMNLCSSAHRPMFIDSRTYGHEKWLISYRFPHDETYRVYSRNIVSRFKSSIEPIQLMIWIGSVFLGYRKSDNSAKRISSTNLYRQKFQKKVVLLLCTWPEKAVAHSTERARAPTWIPSWLLLVCKDHAFALTGRNSCLPHTQGDALGYGLLAFQAVFG